jgi:hypothetical protein
VVEKVTVTSWLMTDGFGVTEEMVTVGTFAAGITVILVVPELPLCAESPG